MEESGQMSKIWTQWKPTLPTDCVPVAEAVSIGFKNLKSAFLIIGVGMIMSVVIVICENLIARKSSRRPGTMNDSKSSLEKEKDFLHY